MFETSQQKSVGKTGNTIISISKTFFFSNHTVNLPSALLIIHKQCLIEVYNSIIFSLRIQSNNFNHHSHQPISLCHLHDLISYQKACTEVSSFQLLHKLQQNPLNISLACWTLLHRTQLANLPYFFFICSFNRALLFKINSSWVTLMVS